MSFSSSELRSLRSSRIFSYCSRWDRRSSRPATRRIGRLGKSGPVKKEMGGGGFLSSHSSLSPPQMHLHQCRSIAPQTGAHEHFLIINRPKIRIGVSSGRLGQRVLGPIGPWCHTSPTRPPPKPPLVHLSSPSPRACCASRAPDPAAAAAAPRSVAASPGCPCEGTRPPARGYLGADFFFLIRMHKAADALGPGGSPPLFLAASKRSGGPSPRPGPVGTTEAAGLGQTHIPRQTRLLPEEVSSTAPAQPPLEKRLRGRGAQTCLIALGRVRLPLILEPGLLLLEPVYLLLGLEQRLALLGVPESKGGK